MSRKRNNRYVTLPAHKYFLYRIVQGSIVNTVKSHPDWKFDPRFLRSLTKRLVGALVAAMPQVLMLSNEATSGRQVSGSTMTPAVRHFMVGKGRRGAPNKRTPLSNKTLRNILGNKAKEARQSGDNVRLDILIELLREFPK